MQRIRTVLIKLTELAQRNSDRNLIDVDLMLDYTRVLYADLLEIRGSMASRQSTALNEPTLDELSAAIAKPPEATTPPAPTPPAFAQQTAVPEPIIQEKTMPTPAATVIPAAALAQPTRDIRKFIDLNDKYLFLSEFFSNDLRAYEEMMNHLNNLGSEREALSFLGHKLDDLEAATAFKAVLARFYAGG